MEGRERGLVLVSIFTNFADIGVLFRVFQQNKKKTQKQKKAKL